MKTLLVTAMLLVSLSALAQQQATKATAQVIQAQGMYIFFQSHPVAEYTVLGTVKKTGLVLTGKPTEMYETILRRAKREYPDCDGIIFDGVDMRHATCIKFK